MRIVQEELKKHHALQQPLHAHEMVLSKPSNITNIQSVKKKLNKTSLRGSIEHDEREMQEMHESFFKDMSKAKLSSVDPAYQELQDLHRKHQKNSIKAKQIQTLLP